MLKYSYYQEEFLEFIKLLATTTITIIIKFIIKGVRLRLLAIIITNTIIIDMVFG